MSKSKSTAKGKRKKSKSLLKPYQPFKNFVDCRNPTEYFITQHGLNIRPSIPENRIRAVLDNLQIVYFCEVSFKGLKSSKNFYFRYDFYIPSMNLIIEYDGAHHQKRKVKKNDNIKNEFCKRNKIRIVRFNKTHYKELERFVSELF